MERVNTLVHEFAVMFITHDTIDAEIARSLKPGVGWCGRCGYPWGIVEEKVTPISGETDSRGNGRSGIFCLCVNCHEILGHPAERLPYYTELMDYWDECGEPLSDVGYSSVIQAVADGY